MYDLRWIRIQFRWLDSGVAMTASPHHPLSRFAPLLLLAALSACAEYDMAQVDEENDSAEVEDALSYLRVDIYPSTNSEGLLPQTRVLSHGYWRNLDLDLLSTSVLRGMVSGWDATPFIEPTVPGADVAIEAQISVYVEDTVMAFADNTNPETGAFGIEIVPNDDYVFAVVPVNPSELPFYVAERQDFNDSTYLMVGLGYGVPVGGHVTVDAGRALAGIHVQAVDSATGIAGPSVVTNAEGYYQLRVMPGEYKVVFSGEEGGYIPTLEEDVIVADDAGLVLDVELGSVEPITIGGEVTDERGNPVEDVTIKVESVKLVNNSGATLSIETKTDQNGLFRVQVLEGQYNVEYIPSYSRSLSPADDWYDISFTYGTQDIGSVALHDFNTVKALVVDAAGEPLPDAGVTARQTGFSAYSYSAVSDEEGYFTMDLPRSEFDFSVIPPQDSDAAVTHIFGVRPEELGDEIALPGGEVVEGVVRYDAESVSYALVEFRDESGNLFAHTVTDSEGNFEVRIQWEDEQQGWDTGAY